MTQQDQLKQIEELWDSLSPELKTIFSARFEYQKEQVKVKGDGSGNNNEIISKKVAEELNSDPNWWKGETIKNTSNASSYIDIKLFYENWKPLCDISSTSSHIQVLEEEVE